MKDMHCCSPKKHWGLLALRLTAGIVFIAHGWGKLTDNPGIGAFSGMVAGIGFPAPKLFAWLVALIEFLGGLALVAGVFIEYTTIALAIIMFVALIAVKKFKLPASDPELALLGSLIALYAMGPGKFAFGSKKETCEHGDEGCGGGACRVQVELGHDTDDEEHAHHGHTHEHHGHSHGHE